MKTKKLAFLGLSVALAMILSYVEHLIPPLVTIPGVKIGLPNLIILLMLYKLGWKEAIIVSIIRILLVAILFGNVQSLLFSASGAVLSLAGMILLKQLKLFSCITVSVVGGVLHNVGQVVVACLWTGTSEVATLLPLYLFSGTVAGVVIGILSGLLVKRLEKIKF